MRLFLAGPMQRMPDFNVPAFLEAANALRKAGHQVYDPAGRDIAMGHDGRGHDGNLQKFVDATGFSLREAFRENLTWLCEKADAVVTLPGWEYSAGATAEVKVARALGLQVFTVDEALGSDSKTGAAHVGY